MKILITGNSGQVARELQLYLAGKGEVIALGRDRLDLGNPELIRQQVRAQAPDLLINAAAYTAVDQAESELEVAFAINATAPGVLAEEAAALGVPLIHYSTDYVFDGTQPGAYTEEDATAPLGAYGRSKLAGEQAIQAVGAEHLILRTSWVYSLHGRNFLLTMQRLLQEREELRVVDDQIGAPTWAGFIAETTALALTGGAGPARERSGVYHLTAAGSVSWCGFARAIFQATRATSPAFSVPDVVPIPSSQYPLPARRPLNSRLDTSKLRAAFGVAPPAWEALLQRCLQDARL
jgi:dTDP-4-dehydrorhamnose reductase